MTYDQPHRPAGRTDVPGASRASRPSVRRRALAAAAVAGAGALVLTGCGLQPAASFVRVPHPGRSSASTTCPTTPT